MVTLPYLGLKVRYFPSQVLAAALLKALFPLESHSNRLVNFCKTWFGSRKCSGLLFRFRNKITFDMAARGKPSSFPAKRARGRVLVAYDVEWTRQAVHVPVDIGQITQDDAIRVEIPQHPGRLPQHVLEECLARFQMTVASDSGYTDGVTDTPHTFTHLQPATEAAGRWLATMQHENMIVMGAGDNNDGNEVFDPEAFRIDSDGLACYAMNQIFYVKGAESMIEVSMSCEVRAHSAPRPRQNPPAAA
jgi:hypothetical protein